jgi:hypothetical protein
MVLMDHLQPYTIHSKHDSPTNKQTWIRSKNMTWKTTLHHVHKNLKICKAKKKKKSFEISNHLKMIWEFIIWNYIQHIK